MFPKSLLDALDEGGTLLVHCVAGKSHERTAAQMRPTAATAKNEQLALNKDTSNSISLGLHACLRGQRYRCGYRSWLHSVRLTYNSQQTLLICIGIAAAHAAH